MTVRASITAGLAAFRVHPTPLGPPETAEAARSFLQTVGQVRPKAELPEAEATVLFERFARAVATNKWTGIETPDWEASWQILWRGPEPLIIQFRFQSRYRRFLESSRTSRPFRRLIWVYLSEFDPAREGSDWTGRLLRKTILQQVYADLEFWREQDFAHEIFSAEKGAKKIAQNLLQSALPPLAFLERIGLGGPLVTRGLALAVHKAVKERLAGEMPPEERRGAFAAWDWALEGGYQGG